MWAGDVRTGEGEQIVPHWGAAVKDAAPEGDLVLLLLELADHDPEVVVVQRGEIGEVDPFVAFRWLQE